MIKVQGLVKRLEQHVVFQKINLEWQAPGMICVCGPNGSGKTTLLAMLAGATAPDAGDILLQGKSLVHQRAASVQLVSYVPDGCPIYPFVTGREWLAFTKSIRLCNAEIEQELLFSFGLQQLLDTRFDAMSLGTAKKFLLTAGLMCAAPIIVLDEPTNGLDVASFGVLRDHLARRKSAGLVVLSCHDQQQQQQLGAQAVDLCSLEAR